MKELLSLQDVDLKIEACKAREVEIPKQKSKFDVQRKRLAAELEEQEKALQALKLEQKECELDIEQKQAQIAKYDQQLFSVKKNEEYQALLHEMDLIKKQVGQREERVLSILMEQDEVRARLEESRKRIDTELAEIDRECSEIDEELNRKVAERRQLEKERVPLAEQVEPALRSRYDRIRKSKKTGPAVVRLNGETCTGCHMHIPPQVAIEVLTGHKMHACRHCGRLLYHAELVEGNGEDNGADMS